MLDLLTIRHVLANNPTDFNATEVRCALHHRAGEPATALVSVGRAAAFSFESGVELLKISEIYRNLGDLPRACTNARRALALEPGLYKAHEILAVNLWDLAAPFYEVGSLYLRVIALEPLFAHGWAALAIQYSGEQLYDLAERALRRAVSSEPASALAHSWLGEIHSALAESSAALRCFDRALAVEPSEDIRRHMLLALLYDPEISGEARFYRQVSRARFSASDHSRPRLRSNPGDRMHVAYLSSKFVARIQLASA